MRRLGYNHCENPSMVIGATLVGRSRMFFIILYGTKHRTETPGVVADYCGICDDMQPFRLIHHFQAAHLFFIPLDRGKHIGTSRICMKCNTEFMCEKAAYKAAMPLAQAGQTPIDDLAAATNPGLLRALRDRAALELKANDPSAASSPEEHQLARMRLAKERVIQWFDGSDRAQKLRIRLAAWKSLDQQQRAFLLAATDTFVDEAKKANQVFNLLWFSGGTYPTDAGCLSGFLVGGAAACLLAFCPAVQHDLWGAIVAAAGIVGGWYVYRRVRYARACAWVDGKLIRLADERNVDLNGVAAMLSQIDMDDESTRGPIRRVAKARKTITRVLLERRKIDMPQEAD
jgi:hypothetical protein